MSHLSEQNELEHQQAYDQSDLQEQQETTETEYVDYLSIFTDGQYLIQSDDGPEFFLKPNGVYAMKYDKESDDYIPARKRLCTPIYVSSVTRNRLTGELVARVAYQLQNAEWYEVELSSLNINENVSSKLSSLGVVINPTPGNKPLLAHYLMLQINELVHHSIHEYVGFRKEEYAEGTSLLFAHGSLEYERAADGTVYHYESQVSERYSKAVTTKGDYEQLVGQLKKMFSHKEVKLALAIGFSAFLHGYLKLQMPHLLNYIVHLHGNSSTGKTTAAKLAVSIGGSPLDAPLKTSWDATANALLNSFQGNFGLPILIDESSMAQRDASDMIYQFSNGEERARLGRDSKQRPRSIFSTICVSTGEQSLRNLDRRGHNVQNAGLSVRAIEVTDIDFMPSKEIAETVSALTNEHYGILGPLFAERLLHLEPTAILETWSKFREEYESLVPSTSNYVNRLSPMFATLEFSIRYAYVCFFRTSEDEKDKISREFLEFRKMLVDIFNEQLKTLDIANTAYDQLRNYITTHIRKFKYKSYRPMHSEVFGEIKLHRQPNRVEVFILKESLEEFLRKAGYTSPKVILREWRDKELMVSEGDRMTSRTRVFGTERVTGYRIKFASDTFDGYLPSDEELSYKFGPQWSSEKAISPTDNSSYEDIKDMIANVELPPQDNDDF